VWIIYTPFLLLGKIFFSGFSFPMPLRCFFSELNIRASQAAGVRLYDCLQYLVIRVDSSRNVMARGDARVGK
jgi:hypothetical protein